MSPSTDSIPVITAAGHIVSFVCASLLPALPECRIVRNRRGHVIRVRAMEDSPWTEDLIRRHKPSRWGQSFEQPIDTGHVWALKGCVGSRRGEA